MKILYYTDQVYLHGGIERVLANKINYLCNNTDHEIFLVTSEQRGKQHCYKMSDKLLCYDLNICYQRDKSYFHLSNIVKVPKHILKLRRLLNSIKPDVLIQCNNAWDFYFIPFISKAVPKIKEYHSSRFYLYDKIINNNFSFRDRFDFWIESKFDKLIALNEEEASFFKSPNVEVIPNSLTFFPSQTADLDSQIVVAAGRLAPVKAFDKLIVAWKLVNLKCPSWKLHIYGEGDDEYLLFLKNHIAKHNLESSVILCGGTNTLMQKFLSSSIFVMSSNSECFPLVLLEAMSCGLASVSFDCPCGPRNIGTDKVDILLAKNGDIMSLASAITKLIDNRDLRQSLSINARKNILRFSDELVLNKCIDVYSDIRK